MCRHLARCASRHPVFLRLFSSRPQVLAGAQDTKFTDLGRQMVSAALAERPPTLGDGGANAGDACVAAVDISAAPAGDVPLQRDNNSRLEHGASAKTRYVEVPAAGHALHIERPEAVGRLLIDWLAAEM